MRAWRVAWISLAAIVLLVVAALLYLGYADLGRHKVRIEGLVTAQLGRSFTIEGPLRLRLFPEIQLHAEKVRLANAEWAAAPDMARIGSVTLRVRFWSLFSGPPEVRRLDLEEVDIDLEKLGDGRANWNFGAVKPVANETRDEDEKGLTEFPLVVHSASIRNVRIKLRKPGQPDLDIAAETMTVSTGEGGLLDVQGRGNVDGRKVALDGRLGPVQALISGRDIRMDLSGSLDRFQLKADGLLGRLHPLQGADLKLALEDPDVSLLLQRLRLPPVASGEMNIAAVLKSVEKGTRLDLDAKAGDLKASIHGTLQALAFKGADLSLKLRRPQGEQLLQALELPVIATGDLRLDARIRDTGRRRQLSLDGALGNLGFKGQGSFRAMRLRDADVELHVQSPEGREVLEALKLPIVATGEFRIDGKMTYADKQHRVDLDARLGDLAARVQGTLPALALIGSDLQVQARVDDARRLGEVFELKGLPASPVELSGRLQPATGLLMLEAVHLKGDNFTATVNGTISRGDSGASLRVEASAVDASRLLAAAPAQPLSFSATMQSGGGKLQTGDLDLQSGESRLTGKVLLDRSVSPAYLEADLASPHLDLSPWLPKQTAPKVDTPKQDAKEKRKLLFSERPLPLGKRRKIDAKLHLRADQVVLNSQQLTGLDARLVLNATGNEVELSATGPRQGSFDGRLQIAVPEAGGVPHLSLLLKARGMRTDLGEDGIAWNERPPLDIDAELESQGESPRQLAAAASGHLLVVEGSGKVKAGIIRVLGGDVLAQLGEKLNPFRESDPYTKLDCLVAKASITKGKVSVDPVLMQSAKVTVTAEGSIDLATERMDFDFATRPRKGIGISPGMFTNPFLKLEGTLQDPGIGVGAKGVASGAVAAATAGASVLAEGLVDRIRGEVDACKKTLEAVRQ